MNIACFAAIADFKKWLQELKNTTHLKIVTSGHFAESAVTLIETDSKLRGVPLLVYCGTHPPIPSQFPLNLESILSLLFSVKFLLLILKMSGDPTSHMPLQKRGAVVTTQSQKFLEFCSKY